jgi:hypothetical protein
VPRIHAQEWPLFFVIYVVDPTGLRKRPSFGSLLSKLADLEPEIGDFVGNIASDKIFSKTGCPSWSKYAVQDKTL